MAKDAARGGDEGGGGEGEGGARRSLRDRLLRPFGRDRGTSRYRAAENAARRSVPASASTPVRPSSDVATSGSEAWPFAAAGNEVECGAGQDSGSYNSTSSDSASSSSSDSGSSSSSD